MEARLGTPLATLEKPVRAKKLGKCRVSLYPDHLYLENVDDPSRHAVIDRREFIDTVTHLSRAGDQQTHVSVAGRHPRARVIIALGPDEATAVFAWVAPFEAQLLRKMSRKSTIFATMFAFWSSIETLTNPASISLDLPMQDLVPLSCLPVAVLLGILNHLRPSRGVFVVSGVLCAIMMGTMALVHLVNESYGLAIFMYVLTIFTFINGFTGRSFFEGLRLHRIEHMDG